MGKICEPELIPPELPSVTKVYLGDERTVGCHVVRVDPFVGIHDDRFGGRFHIGQRRAQTRRIHVIGNRVFRTGAHRCRTDAVVVRLPHLIQERVGTCSRSAVLVRRGTADIVVVERAAVIQQERRKIGHTGDFRNNRGSSPARIDLHDERFVTNRHAGHGNVEREENGNRDRRFRRPRLHRR